MLRHQPGAVITASFTAYTSILINNDLWQPPAFQPQLEKTGGHSLQGCLRPILEQRLIQVEDVDHKLMQTCIHVNTRTRATCSQITMPPDMHFACWHKQKHELSTNIQNGLSQDRQQAYIPQPRLSPDCPRRSRSFHRHTFPVTDHPCISALSQG